MWGRGWASLEALATNPFCACGTPDIISRQTIKYWEGEATFGGTMESCVAKGIGKGNEDKYNMRWLWIWLFPRREKGQLDLRGTQIDSQPSP
eukprot:866348-Karenia_brevis.AAC.1